MAPIEISRAIAEMYFKYADLSNNVLTTMTTLVFTALLGVIGILIAYAYRNRIKMRGAVKETPDELNETVEEKKASVLEIERIVTEIVKEYLCEECLNCSRNDGAIGILDVMVKFKVFLVKSMS